MKKSRESRVLLILLALVLTLSMQTAGVFGVERAALRGDTSYGSIPQWDSVAHLKLVMEAERRFGVSYELERIPGMKTLDDFLV